MSARGSFLHRLTPAITATLFLCVAFYVGVGWAVWSRQLWLVNAIGAPRFHRWAVSYANAMASLFPGDKDRDGVCDGVEYFYRTDSENAASHPALDLLKDQAGFAVAPSPDFASRDVGIFTHHKLLIRPGERLHVHRQLVIAGSRHPVANGLQFRLSPAPYTLLSEPGGTVGAHPLLVSVAGDGRFAFDLELAPGALSDPRPEKSVVVSNAATGGRVATLTVVPIWDGPAVVPSVETWSPAGNSSSPATPSPKAIRLLQLRWPPAAHAEAILVEAARREPGSEWRAVHMYTGAATSAVVAQDLENALLPYAGPLQFRVIPISFTPPPPAGPAP